MENRSMQEYKCKKCGEINELSFLYKTSYKILKCWKCKEPFKSEKMRAVKPESTKLKERQNISGEIKRENKKKRENTNNGKEK